MPIKQAVNNQSSTKICVRAHHRLNSDSQFTMQLVGTTTRWGPQMPLNAARNASNEIVWIVLPRPISLHINEYK
jgi:hypothetical protein